LYDNKNHLIKDSKDIVIKQTESISAETNQRTGVTDQMLLEKGVTTGEAIIQVSGFVIFIGF
jgi:hypothetical protein